MGRLKNRDMFAWNIATDAVINAFLLRDGLIPVEGMIFIDNALAYSSEELYDALTKSSQEEELEVKGDKEQTDQSHQRWSDNDSDGEQDEDNNSSNNQSNDKNKSNSSKNNKQDKKGNSASNSDKSQDKETEVDSDDSNSNNDKNLESDDKSQAQEDDSIDEREVFEENRKKRQENENKLKKKINGKGFSLGEPGFDSPELKINNIGKKTKLIDWRRLLKEACKLDLDYSFKDAQIEDGVLVSHLIEIPSCETEILLDTSGSIDHELLKCFLRECKNILQNSKIKIACFDDKVYDFVPIRTEDDLEKMKFKGGGGTNFVAAAKAFTNRVDNKIIFTDGYGYITNPPLDIIWVVFETAKNLPKEAKVIKIDRKNLIKFNS